MCYFPDSYRKGYQYFLDGRKLSIELELYALGQDANGEWVFLISYFQGLDVARSKLNFMLLAEGQRELFDETTERSQEVVKQSKSLDNVITETARNKDVIGMLLTGYENLRAANQRLKEMAEGSNEIHR